MSATCVITNSVLVPCDTLTASVTGVFTHEAGVTLLDYSDVVDAVNIPVIPNKYAILRSGTYREDGIVMKYCPFCGVEID